MLTLTVEEFHAALKAQGVSRREDFAFVCPICSTVQSGADWVRATGKTFDEVEPSLGFSYIGRATDAGEHKRGTPPGKGCNWTLGGLLRLHKMEILSEGKAHPMFELATAEQAQAHAVENAEVAA